MRIISSKENDNLSNSEMFQVSKINAFLNPNNK